MAIERTADGGLIFTGPDVNVFAMLSLYSALGLECKNIQVKRGFSAYKTIKHRFGYRGNKQRVLEQFAADLRAAGMLRGKADENQP